jgi:competence protein ComEC
MGCIARLPDGTVVSVARTAQAVMEDCEQASLVITTRQAPPGCRALVVDRQTLRDSGAMTLQRADKGWKIERAVPAGAERPWAHTQHHAGASFISATPSPTDATPRADDLQPAD